MSGSFVVVVYTPGTVPRPWEFDRSRIVIGRVAGDIVLLDPTCSATHAEMLFDGRAVRFRDLGSKNGSWVDGQRVEEVVLTPGIIVRIGAHALSVEEVRAGSPAQ